MRIARSNSYLSSGDTQIFVGMNRAKLVECEKKGVVVPFLADEKANADRRWTLTQAQVMRYVSEFRRNGMALEDVAALTKGEHAVFCAQLDEFHMRELRNMRRSSRNMARYRREQAETVGLVGKDGYYLRYIPQRYFALAPVMSDGERPGGPAFMRLLTNAMRVAQVVGWSPVSLAGSIESVSLDEGSSSTYAYCELAARPEPEPHALSDVDSGCYHVISGKRDKHLCGGDCHACIRFGRELTQAEAFDWQARKRTEPNQYDLAVTAHTLREPYLSGAWACYTRAVCGKGGGDVPAYGEECSVVPRLMPQKVLLPFGVTACVMPAGVYLCRQHDERNQAHASERIMEMASILPRRTITEEDEAVAHATLCERMARKFELDAQRIDGSPFPPVVGNPDALGWNRDVELVDFPNLTMLTNMGLAPERGYCIVCEELPPVMTNDEPRFETQILIDASKIAPPPRSMRDVSHGCARIVYLTRSAEGKVILTCLVCSLQLRCSSWRL